MQQVEDIKHTDNDFICPLCLNYIVQAVSTKCGHTFCEICLHEHLLYIKQCPQCDENIRKSKLAYCFILDQMIYDFISRHHKEEEQNYVLARQLNKDWRKNKQVDNLEVGQRVDVRDPNYVWMQGIVKRLKFCQDPQRTKYIIIHYEGRSDKHDEEIPESSPRFAQYGFYTSRKDIPKYSSSKNPFLRKLLTIEQLEDKGQFKDQFYLQEDSSEGD